MSKIIPIERALPGMMILRIAEQNGPVKIRKAGLLTSDAMRNGLMEMGVIAIEIDPEQTVEICNDIAPEVLTPTQALSRGQFDSTARQADSAISEQFNRSLFLPTVNGLPSQWRRFYKHAAIFVLLILGGAGLGYSIAIVPTIYHLAVTQPTQPPVTYVQIPVTTEGHSAAVAVPSQVDEDNLEGSSATSLNNHGVAEAQPAARDVASTTPPEQQTIVKEQQPLSDFVPVVEEQEAVVSPELMARFNKVLLDLENEEASGEVRKEPDLVNVYDDVQRVDQLPVRLLTRLPSMDFSAHMYASKASDRWVRVNGQDKVEGDWIEDTIRIVNIEPQRVVLSFEGELFSMSALTDW